jgi:uncharacterized protein YaaN involved in tellurite resistance
MFNPVAWLLGIVAFLLELPARLQLSRKLSEVRSELAFLEEEMKNARSGLDVVERLSRKRQSLDKDIAELEGLKTKLHEDVRHMRVEVMHAEQKLEALTRLVTDADDVPARREDEAADRLEYEFL